MRSWQLRIVPVLMVAALMASALGVRGAAAQGVDVDRVAIVTPASRTNQAWDQQGVDNLVEVGEELGIEIDVVENRLLEGKGEGDRARLDGDRALGHRV